MINGDKWDSDHSLPHMAAHEDGVFRFTYDIRDTGGEAPAVGAVFRATIAAGDYLMAVFMPDMAGLVRYEDEEETPLDVNTNFSCSTNTTYAVEIRLDGGEVEVWWGEAGVPHRAGSQRRAIMSG